jgi:hypothetical protein
VQQLADAHAIQVLLLRAMVQTLGLQRAGLPRVCSRIACCLSSHHQELCVSLWPCLTFGSICDRRSPLINDVMGSGLGKRLSWCSPETFLHYSAIAILCYLSSGRLGGSPSIKHHSRL